MSLQNLTKEQRDALNDAKRRVKEILKPSREARKIAEAKASQEMARRVGKRAPGQREVRELDNGFRAWLRRLPCIAGVMLGGGCHGPVQAAHIRYSEHGKSRNPGVGRKNHDRHETPLCQHHHISDQHKRKEREFWCDLGVDPYDFAAALYAAYLAGEDGVDVIRRFAPAGWANV